MLVLLAHVSTVILIGRLLVVLPLQRGLFVYTVQHLTILLSSAHHRYLAKDVPGVGSQVQDAGLLVLLQLTGSAETTRAPSRGALAGLPCITSSLADVHWAEDIALLFDVLATVKTNLSDGSRVTIAHKMAPVGGDVVVVGRLGLRHQAHGRDVAPVEAQVAARLRIAEHHCRRSASGEQQQHVQPCGQFAFDQAIRMWVGPPIGSKRARERCMKYLE